MYTLIKRPLFANKDFYDFTKKEAKEYLHWFLSIKDERIFILESWVKYVYPNWNASYTKESLIVLYEWFRKQVSYRPMTLDEKNRLEDQINITPLFIGIIPIPQTTFTDETVSICFDIGIYLGEMLINNLSGLQWFQKLTSKNYIDYAQPLIGKKESSVPVNPRRIVESVAQRIIENDPKQISFEKLYDDWLENFKD